MKSSLLVLLKVVFGIHFSGIRNFCMGNCPLEVTANGISHTFFSQVDSGWFANLWNTNKSGSLKQFTNPDYFFPSDSGFDEITADKSTATMRFNSKTASTIGELFIHSISWASGRRWRRSANCDPRAQTVSLHVYYMRSTPNSQWPSNPTPCLSRNFSPLSFLVATSSAVAAAAAAITRTNTPVQ